MQRTQKPIIVGLGEVLWDVFPDMAHFGGAPANFACHAASLDCDAYIVSAVGIDALGTQVFEEFRVRNVQTKYLQNDPVHTTGKVDVVIDSSGQATYRFASNTAWDNLQWTEELSTLARDCNSVCFGSLAQRSPQSRQTIHRFLEATSRSCLRVFDVNLRQEFYNVEILNASLAAASILKLNEEELPIVAELLGATSVMYRETLPWLCEKFHLQAIALTRGASGSVVYTDGIFDEQGPREIEVVDTVGAGDAFTAALVAGLLKKEPLAVVHQNASDLAAFICTQRGATPRREC